MPKPIFGPEAASRLHLVISGFNTDISHDGVTYHVQTEDKGLDSPFVLSLVYKGGTILASKRSPYEDLIEKGFDETELEMRLQRQHKLICAAIRAGRIEDLVRMTLKESSERPEGLVLRKREVIPADEHAAQPPPANEGTEPTETESPLKVTPTLEEAERETIWDIPMVEDVEIVETSVIDGNTIIEEEIILPPDAVKIIGDLDQFEPLLEDELKVKILGSEVFHAGDRKNVNVLVYRGKDERAVAGAGIMIKVIGSDFRPQIFHSVADSNGVAAVSVNIPEFRSGRAAVLVRAMIGNEEAEMRRVISSQE